jgi:hypothetical protein
MTLSRSMAACSTQAGLVATGEPAGSRRSGPRSAIAAAISRVPMFGRRSQAYADRHRHRSQRGLQHNLAAREAPGACRARRRPSARSAISRTADEAKSTSASTTT